ncbi:MAG: hypothetical protein LJE92_17470 [Gammaproteobacteria bacterium]|jgi:hypothetical protein|nr:hypothetical protein [Gammaproteobacteria bacterium]
MPAMLPVALLLLSLSEASAQSEPGSPIGPLAQSFYPAEDDDRPELFLPEDGDSDPSNFEPVDGDSDADNFESPDLDELALPAGLLLGPRSEANATI